jgi:hypothetical protein
MRQSGVQRVSHCMEFSKRLNILVNKEKGSWKRSMEGCESYKHRLSETGNRSSQRDER